MTHKIKISTNNPKNEISKPHFFVLNKGLNSGKPLLTPCPNCFVVITESNELKEELYWLCYGLWQAKGFHFYLRGSVIPFIIIGEFRKLLFQSYTKALAQKTHFEKTVKSIQLLEEKRAQFLKYINLIDEAKRAVMYRYLK